MTKALVLALMVPLTVSASPQRDAQPAPGNGVEVTALGSVGGCDGVLALALPPREALPPIPEGVRDAPRFAYDGLSSRRRHVYDGPRNCFDLLALDGGKRSRIAGRHVYDADLRIFLSRDSIGASSYLSTPNGMGPWSYANLNPTRYTDPDGRDVGFSQCLEAEKRGIDVASCMKGLIKPNRKRYFPPTEAAQPPSTVGVQAFAEGAADRVGGMVMDPAELAINSVGYDSDFNRISAGQQEQAKKVVDELQGAAMRRAWFPPLLIKDAFVGAGTATAAFGSAVVDGDSRELGGASVDVAMQVPALFEGGLGLGRALTPAESALALPVTRQTMNPLNWRPVFFEAPLGTPAPLHTGINLKGFKYVGPARSALGNVEHQTIKLSDPGWRETAFRNPGDSIIYVLRDAEGEVLKAGKTEVSNFVERFEPYRRAGERTGRSLELDTFAFDAEGFTPETIEGSVREPSLPMRVRQRPPRSLVSRARQRDLTCHA